MTAMRPYAFLSAMLLLALPLQACASPPVASSTHRAYSTQAGMSAIRQHNLEVFTRLAIVGPPPATNGRISFVVYRWQYATLPSGLEVHLCQQQRCVDVSNQPQGRSEAFAGASPAQAFHFKARVPGQGRMLPLFGGEAGLIVNWQE